MGALSETDFSTECGLCCSADQEEVMVFWFGSKIFKDTLLPVSLHVIPVVNEAMTNRIM